MRADRASSCSSDVSPVSRPTTAGDLAVRDGGPVGGPGVAERAATHLDRRREVGPGLVEVRDDDGPRHADGRALTPQQRDGPVDVVGARDDEDGGVGRPQPGAQAADEVGVAGGVEQVEGHRPGRRTRRSPGWSSGRARWWRGAGRARVPRRAPRTVRSCRPRRVRPARRCGCPAARRGWGPQEGLICRASLPCPHLSPVAQPSQDLAYAVTERAHGAGQVRGRCRRNPRAGVGGG